MGDNVLSPVQQAALEQATLVNERLQMRHILSDAVAKSLIEALEVWAQAAVDPRNPHRPAAQHWLTRLATALESAQAARSGIQLAQQIPGGSDGRTERPNGR